MAINYDVSRKGAMIYDCWVMWRCDCAVRACNFFCYGDEMGNK